ncbi:TPA: replication factor C large subunit [Candidatus Bathyarchaeota archaeon]|nr:replication factor C large subunit [Candidatus Bathyarchaeota archaeon]
MTVPWVVKYRPKRLNEVVGNKRAKESLLNWLRAFKQGKAKRKAALLYGPPGTGKTVTVEALARELGYDLIEINASDKRNSEELMRIAGAAASQGQLFGKKRLILLDEIDGINMEEDRGAIQAVNKIIGESHYPVVLTANDPWNPKISPLRNACELIQFKRLSARDCLPYIKQICLKEGIKAEEDALKFLIEKNERDMRSIINDLQALSIGRKELRIEDASWLSYRDRKESIFTALSMVFSGRNCAVARKAVDLSEADYEMLFEWIYENAPRQLTDPKDLYDAMEALAKSNLYFARIKKNQAWNLLPFALDLMTIGVCSSRKRSKPRFTPFKFPERIKYLSQTRLERGVKERVARAIGRACHASVRESVRSYLPYVKFIFKHNPRLAGKIAEELEFDKEMVDFLKR